VRARLVVRVHDEGGRAGGLREAGAVAGRLHGLQPPMKDISTLRARAVSAVRISE